MHAEAGRNTCDPGHTIIVFMKLTTGDCCGTLAGMPISSSGAPDRLAALWPVSRTLVTFRQNGGKQRQNSKGLGCFFIPRTVGAQDFRGIRDVHG